MKSLHERLDPQKETVLSVARTFGRFRAMNKFGVKDYPAFCKWLKEETRNENFGINPEISLDGHQTLGDQLVFAVLRKVAQLQAQNQELQEQIKYLNWQLEQTGEKEEAQALAVLEVCQA